MSCQPVVFADDDCTLDNANPAMSFKATCEDAAYLAQRSGFENFAVALLDIGRVTTPAKEAQSQIVSE